jgi:hypothetical protein
VKIELPSGNWIELRDQLTAGDRTAMYEATSMPVSDIDSLGSPQFRFSIGLIEAQQYAVLANLTLGWSYPYTLPRNDDNVDDNGQKTYQDTIRRLPLEDWDVIEEAMTPVMERLRKAGPKAKTATTSRSTGTSAEKATASRKG